MKNINLLLPNPLLIYHEKFSPRIADDTPFGFRYDPQPATRWIGSVLPGAVISNLKSIY